MTMSRKPSVRTYGKRAARKPQLGMGMPLGELDPNMPSTSTITIRSTDSDDPVKDLTAKVKSININPNSHDEKKPVVKQRAKAKAVLPPCPEPPIPQTPKKSKRSTRLSITTPIQELQDQESLRILTWEDVCPHGDRIEKIAEASYSEVYRITNDRGTSIIKVIRLESPIKPQTKAQQKSRLVDEEPHTEDDLDGELQISELVADIPGFVIYKEKYIVKGKTTPALLETHQTFHKKMKRKDPERLQFYPSPSRYLNDTRFLVVELGDAGTALEDLEVVAVDQIWDILLGVSVALARAENLIRFEVSLSYVWIQMQAHVDIVQHRDLHEGNICFRQIKSPRSKTDNSACQFGYSGLDVTILDYGLSRAEDTTSDNLTPIANDLERDLSLFTSTHAKQCKVYRQMRSYLLKGDRIWLPPRAHTKSYQKGHYGTTISWYAHHPYTNVLWLAYLYDYLVEHFQGGKRVISAFKRETQEFWTHLNPESSLEIMSFSSAEDVVEFAAEAGWITEDQLVGAAGEEGFSVMGEESIIEVRAARADDAHLRRSPRKRERFPPD